MNAIANTSGIWIASAGRPDIPILHFNRRQSQPFLFSSVLTTRKCLTITSHQDLALETVPIDAGFEQYDDTPKISKSMFFYFLYLIIHGHTPASQGGNSAQAIPKLIVD